MTRTMTERIELVVGALLALTLTIAAVTAAIARPMPSYVTIIVKACPMPAENMEPGHPDASGAQGLPNGMIPRAENWNGQGEPQEAREHSRTKAERHAYFRSIGCIDVPIPPEVVTGNMTLAACMGHAGYLASMQYLEQNVETRRAFPSVGEWACIQHPYPVAGVANM